MLSHYLFIRHYYYYYIYYTSAYIIYYIRATDLPHLKLNKSKLLYLLLK